MDPYDFDLFTIGAGSGGCRASRVAASLGARVAVCEVRALGGTCVNVGCVPKKLMVYASHFREEFEQSRGFGWTVDKARFDWATLMEHKNREISRLNQVYEKLLGDAGVTILRGRARLVDSHTVLVGDTRYTAKHVLIATGAEPVREQGHGAEYGLVSDNVFHLASQPRRILVVGGGYIAVEFAGIFNGLESEVTLVHRGDGVLRGFDDEATSFFAGEMRKKGIRLALNASVANVEKASSGLVCTFSKGDPVEVDAVLYAIGRHPNTAGLGLEDLGVKLDAAGAVVVDDRSQTRVPGVFAIGDVTNRMNLTPVALTEGAALARTLFGDEKVAVDYEGIPTAVFGQPPLASVGLTEARARAKGPVDVYTSEFRPLKHTLSGSQERAFVKLVASADSGRIVGAHMVGIDAPEVIQGVAIAMRCGATKEQFDATIGIHPTVAEELVTLRKRAE